MTMAKKWETYGIHALETILPITGPGFETIRNTGTAERNIVHLTHRYGIDVTISVIKDQIGGAGFLTIAGTQGGVQLRSQDTYHAFKTQLEGVVSWLRTGTPPVPWPETQELMKLVICGIESREQGGKVIHINEIEVTQ
jgi:hypothetical protein